VIACRDAGADGVVVGRALLSGAIALPETLAAVAASA
jgi:phosphoribosylformimino-5-aminoimidazole carboxamide ribonucleotide (ProFAR) isomerase